MSKLNHKEAQFIHRDLQDMQTDWYNYQVKPESKPKTVFKNKVSQQEVQVLVKTPADKASIGKLGKELKALNPNSPWIQQARDAYRTSSVFHIKQILNNAIKIEKSTKLCFSALAKINA